MTPENEGKAFLLISVFDRDICAEAFSSLEDAKASMLAELKREFLNEHDEDEWESIANKEKFVCDSFGFGAEYAWSNLDDDCNCDWQIIQIPLVSSR